MDCKHGFCRLNMTCFISVNPCCNLHWVWIINDGINEYQWMPWWCRICHKCQLHGHHVQNLRFVLCMPLRSYAHVLYCHQMGRKHPNPMIPPSWYPATRAFLRESALPVFSEELLPDAVSQNIFMIVTDIDINCIITICTADFSTHGRFITLGCWRKYHISALLPARRVQWMRLCWPAPMPIACPSFT